MLGWTEIISNRLLWGGLIFVIFLILIWRRDRRIEHTALLLDRLDRVNMDYQRHKAAQKVKKQTEGLSDQEVRDAMEKEGYYRNG